MTPDDVDAKLERIEKIVQEVYEEIVGSISKRGVLSRMERLEERQLVLTKQIDDSVTEIRNSLLGDFKEGHIGFFDRVRNLEDREAVRNSGTQIWVARLWALGSMPIGVLLGHYLNKN